MNLQALIGNQAWDDLCEAFVEQASGTPQKYANAITAWTSQNKQARSGLAGIQPGDKVYFSPNEGNGYNGHTGIYQGNGKFLSATDNGVQINDIGQWMKSTGQQLLGYIPQNNPNLKAQMNTLQGGPSTNSFTSSLPQDIALQGEVGQDQNSFDSATQNQQQYQQRLQDAQSIGNWFQGYKQQQANQIMETLPSMAKTYVPQYNFNQNYF